MIGTGLDIFGNWDNMLVLDLVLDWDLVLVQGLERDIVLVEDLVLGKDNIGYEIGIGTGSHVSAQAQAPDWDLVLVWGL